MGGKAALTQAAELNGLEANFAFVRQKAKDALARG